MDNSYPEYATSALRQISLATIVCLLACLAGNQLAYGEYGLQALERGWITNIQIEACRVAANRAMKRKGKLWIRIFPDKPITKKPAEVRMGKGKGNLEYWASVVRPGRILFEISGVPHDVERLEQADQLARPEPEGQAPLTGRRQRQDVPDLGNEAVETLRNVVAERAPVEVRLGPVHVEEGPVVGIGPDRDL